MWVLVTNKETIFLAELSSVHVDAEVLRLTNANNTLPFFLTTEYTVKTLAKKAMISNDYQIVVTLLDTSTALTLKDDIPWLKILKVY